MVLSELVTTITFQLNLHNTITCKTIEQAILDLILLVYRLMGHPRRNNLHRKRFLAREYSGQDYPESPVAPSLDHHELSVSIFPA